MRFGLSKTRTFESYRIARCDVSWHATGTRACDIFDHCFHFDAFSTVLTVHINTICKRFRFDSLSRAFLNGYVFHENAQRISVERRHERIQIYAF